MKERKRSIIKKEGYKEGNREISKERVRGVKEEPVLAS
jgi:hypothetical protein